MFWVLFALIALIKISLIPSPLKSPAELTSKPDKSSDPTPLILIPISLSILA